jgi:pilus assembly protein Flp/PilA
MKWAIGVFVNLMENESGQDLIEYAIVAGLIGMGAVASMSSLSTILKNSFNKVGSNLSNAM